MNCLRCDPTKIAIKLYQFHTQKILKKKSLKSQTFSSVTKKESEEANFQNPHLNSQNLLTFPHPNQSKSVIQPKSTRTPKLRPKFHYFPHFPPISRTPNTKDPWNSSSNKIRQRYYKEIESLQWGTEQEGRSRRGPWRGRDRHFWRLHRPSPDGSGGE